MKAGVLWTGTLSGDSGYAVEGRNLVRSFRIVEAQLETRDIPIDWSNSDYVPSDLYLKNVPLIPAVHVVHYPYVGFHRHRDSRILVWRTTFETESIPHAMLERSKSVDYLWLPSNFNKTRFASAGVAPEKLTVVPQPIDTSLYKPDKLNDPPKARDQFTFLSIFRWQQRKGWDVLVRAFCREFTRTDDVRLVMHISPFDSKKPETPQVELSHLLSSLDSNRPSIILQNNKIAECDMPTLYKSADCFVLPSRGEGWGRPFMEAMAVGTLTIATRWGGQLDYMNEKNSLLIDADLIPTSELAVKEWKNFENQIWVEPNEDHLRYLMREAYEGRADNLRRARRASADIANTYSLAAVGRQIRHRLDKILRDNLSLKKTSR